MNKIYRITWEMVSPMGKGMRFYDEDIPNTKSSDIPDEYWNAISKETDNPWDQYNQLVAWEKDGTQPIRKVQLFESENPQWKPYLP